ncbi:MAG: hypothetical protein A2X86_02175 [Bdellovibrionales bacterium GWA2_49_15]|nr:MAG: hypothetical protein A2X86_02175 [Bdellovibrionales bacterium GWA2_49_15]
MDLLCEQLKLEICSKRNYSRRSNASMPTEQSAFRMNPSAIPTEKGVGIETIIDDGDYNFGLVTGTGKVGAAVGPNSVDDSFFGNMAIEADDEYRTRMLAGKKYKSQKTVLAGAVNLYGGGANRKPVKVNLGLAGRYNKYTKHFKSGVGGAVELGIFSIGYSKYKDEYYYVSPYPTLIPNTTYPYEATVVTFGMKVPYFAIDYSTVKNKLNVTATTDLQTTIKLLSTTFFWRNWMFTWASRTEDSYRPEYDFKTQQFTYVREKNQSFLGLQYSFKNKLILGVFHNYYLLQDYSLGLTWFL